jgi:hypothetical protein
MTFEFDRAGYDRKVRQFAAFQRAGLGGVIRDETRLAIIECVERTPPFDGKRMKGGGKKAGEAAVKRDVKKVFRDPRFLDLYANNDGFKRAVDRGDLVMVDLFLKKAKRYESTDKMPTGKAHREKRDSRGRVRLGNRWHSILDGSAIGTFIEKAMARVGFARSGWAKGGSTFGANLPAWITRHHAPGTASDLTQNTETPMTEVANALPWIQEAGRRLKIVQVAMFARQKKLEAKIRHFTDTAFNESNVKS